MVEINQRAGQRIICIMSPTLSLGDPLGVGIDKIGRRLAAPRENDFVASSCRTESAWILISLA